MSTDVVSYLQSKGLQVKAANQQNVNTHCPFHGEELTERGRLYINVDPASGAFGAWQCFVCGETGGLNKLRKHFGDPPLKLEQQSAVAGADVPDETFVSILNSAAAYYHEKLWDHKEVYDYLHYDRGLSWDSLEKFRLGWADGGLITHLLQAGFSVEDVRRTGLVNDMGDDFLKNKIVIPYQVMGQTVLIRGRDTGASGAKYLTPPGQKARLFNTDALAEPERGEVVICEGEFDAMLLDQMGFAAVGVPGANTWQDAWTDGLSAARRVFICFDNDRAGRAGAEKLVSKFGPRGRIVEMPEAMPGQRKIDVTEWVVNHGKGRDDFTFLFSKSVGGLLVSVREAYERWLEIEGNPDLHGLRWNVKEIDEQMRHGLTPGQVVTLIAKTNSGKTLMSLNLFHRMSLLQPELRVLFVSLEQTRNEWFERARRIHSFYDPWATEMDTIKYWAPKLYIVDKNRVTEDELEASIEQYEYETGHMPDLVCVDYLGYYSRSFKGEAYERTTSAVMGLKGIAKRTQTVVFAPHQVNRTANFGKEIAADMAKESGAVEETSDMMLAIWNPDQQPGKTQHDQAGEIHMKVLKSRDGAAQAEVIFQFAPKTLAIVPNTDPLVSRVMQERLYAQNSHTWEEVVYRYRSGDASPMGHLDKELVAKTLQAERPGVGLG